MDKLQIVPRLQPEALQRVIQTRGLENCAEFVALATTAELARVLDLDLWRAPSPGADERFDPDRFGVWLEVLLEAGPDVAAEKLAGLDLDLVVAGFAQHIFVFDVAAATPYTMLDGAEMQAPMSGRTRSAEIGGYAIETRRISAWDAIVDLLTFLASERAEYFHRLMRGCVRLSSGTTEEDASQTLLDDAEQHLFDVAAEREARRDQQGYVASAQANAFLRSARDLRLDGAPPEPNAIARAYFRSFDRAVPGARELPGAVDASVRTQPSHVEQLAFLANAVVAGCAVQGRPFTEREAGDLIVATCNLGTENWPSHWPDRDPVTAFQVGWRILHRDVCVYASKRLVEVLGGIVCSDHDTQLGLDRLRRELIRHLADGEPWRVRESLEVILALDAPAWAALVGLIAECPVLHVALGAGKRRYKTVSPTDFTFISGNADIAAVREFMESLPSALA